jgi:hypothetical protein
MYVFIQVEDENLFENNMKIISLSNFIFSSSYFWPKQSHIYILKTYYTCILFNMVSRVDEGRHYK